METILAPAHNKLLFGHESERQFLQKQLKAGHMHHALLFEGQQGIGKAILAFHFAYHILAGHSENTAEAEFWKEPDTVCPVWRKMGQGAHPGLLYINRGYDPKSRKLRNAVTIDEVRRISHFLQQTAADKGWRIVIIDPADDMNRNAANALLKTLEEPPAKTLFILISHNLGRLLPTIRSRCQWIRFKPLPEEIMRKILPHIAASAGYDNEVAQSKEIINLAEGSVCRALILLTENGINIVNLTEDLLKSAVFPVLQAQSLADNLSKGGNSAAYTMFLHYILDFIHKKACLSVQEGNLAQAAVWAEFFSGQERAMQEAQAFNLDKKQFILVLLQQTHEFFHANGARVA